MTLAPKTRTTLSLAFIFMFLGTLFVLDGKLDTYTARILNLVAINAILAISLNLIYGFTGMFSLGHAGFMAIGAYACTILILSPEQKEMMWLLTPIHPWLANISLPFLPAVLIGGFMAAIAALVIAIPVLRLGGDYLGIATLGFAEIIRVVITNAAPVTNGSLGIKGIPENATLLWTFGWLIATVYAVNALLKSNVGNVLKAIRDDEIAARTMGVDTFFYRVLSFCIGAFFAGVGGALTAALISTIDSKMFGFMLTFNVLMIVVAGGLGSVTGSIIGSIVITIMLEWLRIVETPIYFENFEIPGIPGMRMVIFSVLLMFIIIFRRNGLMAMREFTWEAFFSFWQNLPSYLQGMGKKVAGIFSFARRS